VKAYRKAWGARNRDRLKAYSKARYARNPDYLKDWRARNPDRVKAYYKAYKELNHERYQQSQDKGKLNYRLKYRVRVLIQGVQGRARRKHLPFDLRDHEAELAARLEAGHCELTGLPFAPYGPRSRDHRAKIWNTASFDRIEPAKGYVYSNIRVICFGMNMALGWWGEEVLRQMVTAWLARR
jgi:hypothetical protein